MTVFLFLLHRLLAFLALNKTFRTVLIEVTCHKSTLYRLLAILAFDEAFRTSFTVLLQKISLENLLTKLARDFHLWALKSVQFYVFTQYVHLTKFASNDNVWTFLNVLLASVLRELYATLKWALNVNRLTDVIFEFFIAHYFVEVMTAFFNTFEQKFLHNHQVVAVRLNITTLLPAVRTFISIDPVQTGYAN